MTQGTIQTRLRWRIPAMLLACLLVTQAWSDEIRPTIRASRPLRKSTSTAPTIQQTAGQSTGPKILPPLPRQEAALQRLAQAEERSEENEFAYPIPPAPGSSPSRSQPGESEPSVVEPLFDSLVPTEPQPGYFQPEYYYPDQWVEECEDCEEDCFGPCSPWYRLFHLGIHEPTCDAGIGQERVMFAPFTVDFSQPTKYYRLRFDMAYGLTLPDRAEYFFAKPGKGPKYIERSVDYQDIRFQVETGGELFSIFTDYPVRILDPEINGNTAGFGDMIVGNKAVLINGKYWQLTQVLRTYINTGDPQRGLGTGHTSMEPGLILRYKWTPKTYLHGELKYFTPVGADPMFSGALINYGFSIATVWYETDTFAILPTWEVTGTSVLDGRQTVPLTVLPDGSVPGLDPTRPVLGRFPFIGQSEDVDGASFGTVQGGVRFVLGPKGDLGLLEVGVSGAISTANNAFFDHRAQIEFRWSY